MSLETAIAAIRARAETQWVIIEPGVPLAFPNENDDSQGNALPPLNPQPWVMIEVRWNGGEFVSIGAPGNNLARREGNIWAFAFIPQGNGEADAHRLASEAASIFEGRDFSGITCQAMSPGGGVDSDNGMYYGQSASVPFTFDETA